MPTTARARLALTALRARGWPAISAPQAVDEPIDRARLATAASASTFNSVRALAAAQDRQVDTWRSERSRHARSRTPEAPSGASWVDSRARRPSTPSWSHARRPRGGGRHLGTGPPTLGPVHRAGCPRSRTRRGRTRCPWSSGVNRFRGPATCSSTSRRVRVPDRPADRRGDPAARRCRARRRSSRCGARSSTSSGRRWRRSSPTARSSRSPPRSARASAATSRSTRSATGRSSSSRTPTSTAATSARC